MIRKESPLQGINIGTTATVIMRELPALPATDLRAAPGTPTFDAVKEALGMDLPQKPGGVGSGSGGDAHALCLAPDWWLITGFSEAGQKLAPLLAQDHHFSAVNVSGQRTIIELAGPVAAELLAQLWEQDLREKSFPVGTVSQGLMAKSPVILWHIAPQHYRIIVRCSFAVHLWKVLEDAAIEWI